MSGQHKLLRRFFSSTSGLTQGLSSLPYYKSSDEELSRIQVESAQTVLPHSTSEPPTKADQNCFFLAEFDCFFFFRNGFIQYPVILPTRFQRRTPRHSSRHQRHSFIKKLQI